MTAEASYDKLQLSVDCVFCESALITSESVRTEGMLKGEFRISNPYISMFWFVNYSNKNLESVQEFASAGICNTAAM